MKKSLCILIAIVIILSFSGCGSSPIAGLNAKNASMDWNYSAMTEEAPAMMPEPNAKEDYSAFNDGNYGGASESNVLSERKMIRTFDLTVETLEFEDFIGTLRSTVSSFGGYIENSNVEGNSYNYSSNRYASFTCRIPSNKLDEFVNSVDGLGNVTYRNENQQDVTLSYVDTEAHIASLQTEYDRLLELLAEAENLDSIIVLEERLSEVRYQLESYKSQLRTYDNLVDYSTVNVYVNEVKRVTNVSETETVWQRIAKEFDDNLYDVWRGLEDFFVWVIANIPYFAVLAVIIIIIVVIINLLLRKSPRYQAKRAFKKAEKERRKAEKLAKKNKTEETPEAETESKETE